MYEEHGRVAGKADCEEIFGATGPIRHPILIAPKRDVIAGKPSQNPVDFPNDESTQNGSYIPRLLEEVIVANMEAQFASFLLKNVQFAQRSFPLLWTAIDGRGRLCVELLWTRVFVNIGEVVCCTNHGDILIGHVGPTHHPSRQIAIEKDPEN